MPTPCWRICGCCGTARTPELPFVRVAARFWRVLAPRWSHDPLSGAGAARYGGRWNAVGTPALYMSVELTTAVAEYEQELGIRPGAFCAYDVAVADLLDLRDDVVLTACGIDADDCFCAWKSILLVRRQRPPGWDIAERLAAAGAAGVIVPSARPAGGSNLVLWRWNDAPHRIMRALDPLRDLPADQASWPPGATQPPAQAARPAPAGRGRSIARSASPAPRSAAAARSAPGNPPGPAVGPG